MAPADLRQATIPQLAELLKSRKLSAQDLAKEFAASKETLKLAKQVDGDFKRERLRGPLQGIPFSAVGLQPDSFAVARLERAGALRVETGAFTLAAEPISGMAALRPTYGLVSRRGMRTMAWTLDSVTLSCRTPEDCGLVLQGAAGGDNDHPGSAHKSFYYTPQYTRAFTDLRIGYLALAQPILAAAGAVAVPAKLSGLPYAEVAEIILACEGASAHGPDFESGRFDERHASLFRAGLTVPARDYLAAQRIRRMVQSEFHKLFSDLDALVLTDSTPATLAGLPVFTLPAGTGTLLIAGPPFSENTLLALAQQHRKTIT